jgi:hypothetical protein
LQPIRSGTDCGGRFREQDDQRDGDADRRARRADRVYPRFDRWRDRFREAYELTSDTARLTPSTANPTNGNSCCQRTLVSPADECGCRSG